MRKLVYEAKCSAFVVVQVFQEILTDGSKAYDITIANASAQERITVALPRDLKQARFAADTIAVGIKGGEA